MMNILVTGGQGPIGLELARQDWLAHARPLFPTREELDITSQASVDAYFSGFPPAAVVNTAAYTAVDKAEIERDQAWHANRTGPAMLAAATLTAGIPLIHVSTNYVLDGTKSGYYVEDDAAAPLGTYGASRGAGDEAVPTGNARSIVLRTAWILSAHRNNFVRTMLHVGATTDVMRVIDDQIGCSTSAQDIARVLKPSHYA